MQEASDTGSSLSTHPGSSAGPCKMSRGGGAGKGGKGGKGRGKWGAQGTWQPDDFWHPQHLRAVPFTETYVSALRSYPGEAGEVFVKRQGAKKDMDLVSVSGIAQRLHPGNCEALARPEKWVSMITNSLDDELLAAVTCLDQAQRQQGSAEEVRSALRVALTHLNRGDVVANLQRMAIYSASLYIYAMQEPLQLSGRNWAKLCSVWCTWRAVARMHVALRIFLPCLDARPAISGSGQPVAVKLPRRGPILAVEFNRACAVRALAARTLVRSALCAWFLVVFPQQGDLNAWQAQQWEVFLLSRSHLARQEQ
eukprot:s175_g19.t1